MIRVNPYPVGIGSGGGGDPLYNQVALLLHCDGTNGGTSFPDNSPSPRTVTATGAATTSTAQFQYGTASYLGTGAANCGLSLPSDAAFAFGTGDWTFEFATRWTAITGTPTFWDQGTFLIQAGSGTGLWQVTIGGTLRLTETSATPNLNQWYSYRITRSSGNLYIFRDGVLAGTTANATSIGAAAMYIGRRANGSSSASAYLDEIRVTSASRGTSNYTPSGPFPNSL